jgi:hypothetical protein
MVIDKGLIISQIYYNGTYTCWLSIDVFIRLRKCIRHIILPVRIIYVFPISFAGYKYDNSWTRILAVYYICNGCENIGRVPV